MFKKSKKLHSLKQSVTVTRPTSQFPWTIYNMSNNLIIILLLLVWYYWPACWMTRTHCRLWVFHRRTVESMEPDARV